VIEITVTDAGFDRIQARLDRILAKTESVVPDVAERAAEIVNQSLKEFAPVRTGRFRAGIHFRVDGGSVRFFDDQPYTPFIIDGTSRHTYGPSMKKFMFWVGARHPVKIVHHPGNKANPFRRFAMEASLGPVDILLSEIGREIVG
jgi:hypothetical protein